MEVRGWKSLKGKGVAIPPQRRFLSAFALLLWGGGGGGQLPAAACFCCFFIFLRFSHSSSLLISSSNWNLESQDKSNKSEHPHLISVLFDFIYI